MRTPPPIGGTHTAFADDVSRRSSFFRDGNYSDGDFTGPYFPESGGGDRRGRDEMSPASARQAFGSSRAAFVNGIENSIVDHQNLGQRIADEMAGTVVGVYNRSGYSLAQKAMQGRSWEPPPENTNETTSERVMGWLAFAFGMVTDLAQAALDESGVVSTNPATRTIIGAMRSGGPNRWIGHSQGSLILVSALRSLEFSERTRFTIDLIGSQVASAPPGPNYMRMVGTDDIGAARIAQALFQLKRTLGLVTGLSFGRMDDVNLGERSVGVTGYGHDSGPLVGGLEEGRETLDPGRESTTPLDPTIPVFREFGVLDRVNAWLVRVIRALEAGVSATTEAVLRAAISEYQAVRALVASAAARIAQLAWRTGAAVGRGIVRLGASAADLARDIANGVTDGISWIAKRVRAGIQIGADVLITIGQRLYGIGTTVVGRGWELLSYLYQNRGALAFRAFEMLIGGAGFVLNSGTYVLRTALDAARMAFDRVTTFLGPLADMAQGWIERATSAASPIVEALSAFGNRLLAIASRVLDRIGDVVAGIVGRIPVVGQSILSLAQRVRTFLMNPVQPVIALVMQILGQIQARMARGVENLAGRSDALLQEIVALVHRAMALINSIPALVQSAIHYVVQTVGQLQATVGAAVDRVLEAVPMLLRPVARAIANFGSGVWSVITSTAQRVANGFLNLIERGRSVASRVVSGFDFLVERIRSLQASAAQLIARTIRAPGEMIRSFGSWVMGGRAPDQDLAIYDRREFSAAGARALYGGPGQRPAPPDGGLFGPFYPSGYRGRETTVSQALASRSASVYVNGQVTTPEQLFDTCETLATELGRPVVGLFNRSGSVLGMTRNPVDTQSTDVLSDTAESTTGKIGMFGMGIRTPATVTLINILRQYGTDLDLHGHSQGTIIISEALRHLQREGQSFERTQVNFYGTAVTTVPESLPQQNLRVFAYDNDLVSFAVGPRGMLMPWRIMGAISPLIGMRGISDQTVTMHHMGSGIRPHGMIADGIPLLDAQGQPVDGQFERFPDGRIVREDAVYERDPVGRLRRDAQGMPVRAQGPVQAQVSSYVSDRRRFLEADAVQRQQGPVGRVGRVETDNTMETLSSIAALLPGSVRSLGIDDFLNWYQRRKSMPTQFTPPPDWLRMPGSGGAIQRSGDSKPIDPNMDPATIHREVTSLDGIGQNLPTDVAASMGRALGADFGQVRIHTGPKADEASQALSARAFTTGQDIFFRQGEYQPNTESGRKLLAHELTHVVQQSGGSRVVSRYSPGSTEAMEREAEHFGGRVGTLVNPATGIETDHLSVDVSATDTLALSEPQLELIAKKAYRILEERVRHTTTNLDIGMIVIDVTLGEDVGDVDTLARQWADQAMLSLRDLGAESAPERTQAAPQLSIYHDSETFTAKNTDLAGIVDVANIRGNPYGPAHNSPSVEPDWWNRLYDLGHTKGNPNANKTTYRAVRMHLWNGRLEGPGDNPLNLAAGPASTNSSMSAGPETAAKDAVAAGYAIWLNTEVWYQTATKSLADLTSIVPNRMKMEWGYMMKSGMRAKNATGTVRGAAQGPGWDEAIPPPPGAMSPTDQTKFRSHTVAAALDLDLAPLTSPIRLQAFGLVAPALKTHMVLKYKEIWPVLDPSERTSHLSTLTTANVQTLVTLQGFGEADSYHEIFQYIADTAAHNTLLQSLSDATKATVIEWFGWSNLTRVHAVLLPFLKTRRDVFWKALNDLDRRGIMDGLSAVEFDALYSPILGSPSVLELDAWARTKGLTTTQACLDFLRGKLNATLANKMAEHYQPILSQQAHAVHLAASGKTLRKRKDTPP